MPIGEIKKIPIPEFSKDAISQIDSLARELTEFITEEKECEINELIMDLYGLNEEEKDIIRNS